MEVRRGEDLLKAGAWQKVVFNSTHFSSIAADVVNKIRAVESAGVGQLLQAGWQMLKPIKVGEFMETRDAALDFAEKAAGQGK